MFKIKNLLLVSILFNFIFITACKTKAQNSTSAAAPSATEFKSNEKSLLWEITGKDLKKPSYLYGTIHIIPKKDFFMTDATKKAFSTVDKVTFEINMKDMNNPMAMMSVLSKAMMADGKKLRDLLTKDDYKVVENKFDSLGLPLKMLERMKPMFLSVMVGNDGEQLSMNGNNADAKSTSYEMEFYQMGETQKKEFSGLETIEFQMSIFDSIPYKVQAEMLVKTIKSGNSGHDEMVKMVEMYKAQDIDAMSKMLQSEDESEIAGYENMLVDSRNRNWIPLMAKAMKEKSTFFAVGAGHLGGKNGVVHLLKKEGYKVKPLN